MSEEPYAYHGGTFDPEGNPITWEQHYALFHDEKVRRVALDEIGRYRISTVYTGIDATSRRPPAIYETALFIDGQFAELARTPTRVLALQCHAGLVSYVRAKIAVDES